MAIYVCRDCAYEYDEGKEGVKFADLPAGWECPVCQAPKSMYDARDGGSGVEITDGGTNETNGEAVPDKSHDDLEEWMTDIRQMSETGRTIDEAMRTRRPVIGWDDILFKGAQLSRSPLFQEDAVSTRTVIGPRAEKPLVIETPVYVSHMSFGALSKEAKEALARGSALAKTAMCSGEGGILEESISNSYRYIFEYVPNLYGVTLENMRRVHAVEIKIGQSAKPGMGGHLPGSKVTEDIARARGFPAGQDILSPSRFKDISTPMDLRRRIDELREMSSGVPIGVKIAAGRIEEDLDFILSAGNVDFITIDGRPGGTGSSPKYIKMATSVPTLFALSRARRHLDKRRTEGVSLVITGGLRIAPDFAKALAMGADAVAVATSALISIGCRQFRMCNTGRCPYGITSQDSDLRARMNVPESARRLENFLRVSTEDLAQFARIVGKDNVHKLSTDDLCTTNSEISNHTDIPHA